MKFSKALCVSSVALVLLFAAVAEGRSSRHHGRHSRKEQKEEEPAVSQVQQEEPKAVEIEPAQSEEATSGSAEKARPARQRKAPVMCNAAAATLDKPDEKETPAQKFTIIKPESAESPEVPSMEDMEVETPAAKPKPVKKPKGKVVKTSSEEEDESASAEDDDDSKNNFSAALASLEEPEAPKAVTNIDVPKAKAVETEEEATQAVESEEEKPKARRSKHHRKDVRRIERPHRRRVVFQSSEEE